MRRWFCRAFPTDINLCNLSLDDIVYSDSRNIIGAVSCDDVREGYADSECGLQRPEARRSNNGRNRSQSCWKGSVAEVTPLSARWREQMGAKPATAVHSPTEGAQSDGVVFTRCTCQRKERIGFTGLR